MELLLLLRLSLWWAQQFYDESIAVHRQAGEPWGSGIQLVAAAAMRILRGDHEQARRQASEALSLFEELEDPRGMAWSLEVFAGLLAAYGDSDGAACIWAASEQVRQRMGASLAAEYQVDPRALSRRDQENTRSSAIRNRLRRRSGDVTCTGSCARASTGRCPRCAPACG